MEFSKRIQIEPSASIVINSIALQKKQQGIRVYNLSAGEPMVKPPEIVTQAAIKAIQEGKTKYPPVAGLPDLRIEASKWMNTTFGSNYSSKNVLVTAGGKYGIYSTCEAFLDAGDEVIIMAPYYVSYPSIVKLFGGVPVIIKTTLENEWKVNAEDIKKACTAKTKLLILNNAANPTGVLYTKDEILEILKVAKENNLIVIADEVYNSLVYEGEFVSCSSFEDYKDNVIIIQSCSKSFAMTGWRIGLVFASEEIISNLTLLQGQATSGAPTPGQWCALEAFKNYDLVTQEIRSQMLNRRNVFIDTFNKLFPEKIDYPKSSLYALIPISAFGINENDSVKFCKAAMEIANVAMVPGSAYGMDGYVRCSFGDTEQELTEALEVLSNFIKTNYGK